VMFFISVPFGQRADQSQPAIALRTLAPRPAPRWVRESPARENN
jgi:hypothetical protein